MAWSKVGVLGTGGVGSLVARMLSKQGLEVVALDQKPNPDLPGGVEQRTGDAADPATLKEFAGDVDAVVSCLPYQLTIGVAQAAHDAKIAYFDLTEDVASTEAVKKLAETSEAPMVPQCGLAPGFIGILGAHIAGQFEFDESNPLRSISLRVGALPQSPIGQLGYAANWSLDGLVHECIAECDVIMNGERKKIPALRNAEKLILDGNVHEAFTTSGGLGTMTETYLGKVEELNYKSIRYPGHLDGMKLLLEEMRFKDNPDMLVEHLANAVPPDPQDRVLVHASVQGQLDGKMQSRVIASDYRPKEIDGKEFTAIAWTTAGSVVAVMELARNGKLPDKGFVSQENISLKDFLNTQTGQMYADGHPELEKLCTTHSSQHSKRSR